MGPVRAGDQSKARPVNELESVRLLQQVTALIGAMIRLRVSLPMARPTSSLERPLIPSVRAGRAWYDACSEKKLQGHVLFRRRW